MELFTCKFYLAKDKRGFLGDIYEMRMLVVFLKGCYRSQELSASSSYCVSLLIFNWMIISSHHWIYHQLIVIVIWWCQIFPKIFSCERSQHFIYLLEYTCDLKFAFVFRSLLVCVLSQVHFYCSTFPAVLEDDVHRL